MSHHPLIPTPEESLLLAVASRTASRVEPVTARRKKEYNTLVRYCANWRRFMALASRQKIAAFATRFIEDYELGDAIQKDVLRVMRERYGFSQAMYLKKSRELLEVLELLGAEHIKPVVLKGIPLARLLYTDPVVRVSRDIDLLCREDDLDTVDRILIAAGFTRYEAKLSHDEYRKYHYHVVYARGEEIDSVVEVHWNVRRAFKGPKIDMTPIFDNAQTVEVDGRPVSTPGPVHALWHLAVNLSSDDFLDLRDLGDMRRLSVGLGENEWARLAELCVKSHTQHEVKTALSVMEVTFGKVIPEGTRRALRPPAAIRTALLPTYTPRGVAWRWTPYRYTHTLAVSYFMRKGAARKIGFLARILFPNRASLIETRSAKQIPKAPGQRVNFYWKGFWILKKVVWFILFMPILSRLGSWSETWLDPEAHMTLKGESPEHRSS